MAEVSPLTSAHNHARQAGKESSQADLKQAAEEHRHAASDFSRAAKCTSDNEALRVLKLLEDQHRRLADIVKSRDVAQRQPPPSEAAEASEPVSSNEAPASSSTRSEPAKTRNVTSKSATTAMGTSRGDRYPRDSSPSLARDIASRRGIPQPSAAAKARSPQQQVLESRQKTPSAPRIPPSIVDSQAHLRRSTMPSKKGEDDDGFTKFYSNVTSGAMSKLSSVLAYAGLPLKEHDALNNDLSSKEGLKKKTVSASNDPDVKRIYSKAALEAIEDHHRERGTLGRGFGPAESFYVVQTGGGTYSYADITRAKQQRLGEAIDDDEDDAEFVDAKEAAGPPSPKQLRRGSKRRSFGLPRTEEELELENSTLKSTLEQLAARLAAFEAHAQDASMAALTQSMMGGKPPVTGSNDAAMRERIRMLQLEKDQKSAEADEAKQKAEAQAKELRKFRRHFEALKEGARKKEVLKQERLAGQGDGVTGE